MGPLGVVRLHTEASTNNPFCGVGFSEQMLFYGNSDLQFRDHWSYRSSRANPWNNLPVKGSEARKLCRNISLLYIYGRELTETSPLMRWACRHLHRENFRRLDAENAVRALELTAKASMLQ